jgi:putative acetyltransferase
VSAPFALRRYTEADEAETVALWVGTWKVTYPQIDFDARRAELHRRWRDEIVPPSIVTLATTDERILGFITVEPERGYVDQFAVAPQAWRTPVAAALINEAKRLSQAWLELHVNQDNFRAIRFYEKHAFAKVGEGINPRSGLPIFYMRWRGAQPV